MEDTNTTIQEEQQVAQEPVYDADKIKEFLNNKQTQITLAEQARTFENEVGKNWFTLTRVMRKSQYRTPETAKTIMDVLVMAGLAHSKMSENSTLMWKITMSKADKIDALTADTQAIDVQIAMLENKKKAIAASIKQLQEAQSESVQN